MVSAVDILAARRPRTRTVTLRLDGAGDVPFTFRALSRSELDGLKAKFPASDEQWDRFQRTVRLNPFAQAPEYDPMAFAPDLLAACAVDPPLTSTEAALLWDTLSDGEAARLYEAALAVCMEAPLAPLSGAGTGGTPTSGVPSTTSVNGESPTADS